MVSSPTGCKWSWPWPTKIFREPPADKPSLQAHGALYSWQYLFLIEGAVPVLLGLAVPFWLAGDIKSAWYLSETEKAFAEKRMIVDSAANYGRGHNVTRRDFKEAFLDWRVWSIMISNTLASLSSQGFTVFFPVVVAVSAVHYRDLLFPCFFRFMLS